MKPLHWHKQVQKSLGIALGGYCSRHSPILLQYRPNSSYAALVETTDLSLKKSRQTLAFQLAKAAGENDKTKVQTLLQNASENHIDLADNVVSSIITILLQNPGVYSSAYLVSLLEHIFKRNITLRTSVFVQLTKLTRYIKDPFVYYACLELIQRYHDEHNRNSIDLATTRLWSQLDSQGIEPFWSACSRPESLDMKVLTSVLGSKYPSFSDGSYLIALDVLKGLESSKIHPRLRVSLVTSVVEANDYSALQTLWERLGADVLDSCPDYYLCTILTMAVEQQDLDMAHAALATMVDRKLPLTESTLRDMLTLSICSLQGSTDRTEFLSQSLVQVDLANASFNNKISYKTLDTIGDLLDHQFIDASGDLISGICKATSISQSTRTLLMNVVLDRFSSERKPSFVLISYRKFVDAGAVPDQDTFYIVINAAYRLGNAKKLSYAIYQEMHTQYGIEPTGAIMETILNCQFTGTDYSSANYFLAQMALKKIPLRYQVRHLLTSRASKMGDDSFAKKLAAIDPNTTRFCTDFQLEKSASSTQGVLRYSFHRDRLNTFRFKQISTKYNNNEK